MALLPPIISENLEIFTRLASLMGGKHSEMWLVKKGLGGRAYAELQTGRAGWLECTAPLKSPI